MKSKAVFTRFCILQGAYWAFQAAMVGYYTAYVISCGMAPSTWGLIMAANLLCSFLGSIFWAAGWIAGRSGCPWNVQRGYSADCHRVLSLDFPGWKTKAESIRNLLLCVNVKT